MRRPSAYLLILAAAGCSSHAESTEPTATTDAAISGRAHAVIARLGEFSEIGARTGRGGRLAPTDRGFRVEGMKGVQATFPRTAEGTTHIAADEKTGMWIDLLAEKVAPQLGETIDGAVVYANVAPETDLVLLAQGGVVEETRILQGPSAPARVSWSIRVGVGIDHVRARQGRFEAVDATGRVQLGTAPVFAVDAKGEHRDAAVEVVRDGDRFVATATLRTDGLAYPIALDPGWSTVASTAYVRSYSAGATLPSGKFLVAGGSGVAAAASTSEVYDPVANTWTTATIPGGPALYSGHRLVAFSTKAVLFGMAGPSASITAEYVYSSNSWNIKPVDPTPRMYAVVVPTVASGDEIALVVGGENWSGAATTVAQGYDVTTSSWTGVISNLAVARTRAMGAQIGTVSGFAATVIAGGTTDGSTPLATAELHNTATTWVTHPPLAAARFGAAAVKLNANSMLVVGGTGLAGGLSSAEVMTDTGAGVLRGTMRGVRRTPAAALLSGGQVLVLGDSGNSVDVWEPTLSGFLPAADTAISHTDTNVLTFGTNKALVVGSSTLDKTVEVFDYAPLGTSCSLAAPCAVGTCVDGYCCDTGCTEQCKACNVGGKFGTCTNVTGEPPHGARSSCGAYLNCTAGACATTCSADTQCGSGYYCASDSTCKFKVATGGACTATNACVTGLTCVDGVCCNSTSCAAGSSCANVGREGNCTKNLGTACTTAFECGTNYCVDGVCCNGACTAPCQACSAAKKGGGTSGTCANIADGSDPDAECPGQTCTGTTQTNAQVCNGAGACKSNGTVTCATGFACVGTACATSCTTDTSCGAGYYCAGSTCVTKKAMGAACAAANQCGSGFCADGVCCDTACGACKACTTALKGGGVDGTCGDVAADTDPHSTCAPDSAYPRSCKQDGACDGTGKCRDYAKSGTACDTTTCTDGKIVGKVCNGAGLCESSAGTSCAPYSCDSAGLACATACSKASDCAPTAYCSPAGTCSTKKAAGGTCANDTECGTGFCTDGVCCDKRCDGQCEACDGATKGTCAPVSGKPHGSRTACAGDAAECGGACDGTTVTTCSYPAASKSCGTSCAAGVETKKVCDGKGACIEGATSKCLPFACDGTTKCLTLCGSDGDCATGFRCSSGACAPSSAKCSDDGTASIDGTGKSTSCAAYTCDTSSGTCNKTCNTSSECANGNVCDPSTKTCGPAPAATEDSGGCSTTHGGSHATLMLLLLAIGALVRRRASRFAP